ncbi:MAG TPA: patatin-like phospholipase family protein [Vicinamibacterales bacterium]|nr:patatin-like phospholipase family protein [Vicinamibacterales bacterium]
MPGPRLGLVLSAGGLRGAAHLGVLRRLIAEQIPIDVMVGVSAGAVVGAYYAAVGMSIDDIIADAPRMRLRHLLVHGLSLRVPAGLTPWMRSRTGILPARLAALERAGFDTLHHGVCAFGVVCHDVRTRTPWYFSTAESHGVTVATAVKASAAVPIVFPPRSEWVNGRELRLVDGGFSDGVPIAFARGAGLGATHVVVSDCRRAGPPVPIDDRTLCLRPALRGIGAVRSVSFSLDQAVAAGEAAVTDAVIARLRAWIGAVNNVERPNERAVGIGI